MDTMPSAEFRKVYAKLKATTVVTVNGHPIGQWVPTPNAIDDDLDRLIEQAASEGRTPKHQFGTQTPAFNTRPFTPVPKTGVRDLR
jgi:hypothetical protein